MKEFNRRDFLTRVTVAGAALLVEGNATMSRGQGQARSRKLHGVNLGGWLVLEKWIKPSLFAGVRAGDEYTLCQELGRTKASELLKRHRETWITEDDFKWLAARGINTVRLPVGYWVAEENPPFLTGLDTMDWAFRRAKENGLDVLLDLHGAPGSQNGWDHSGRQGALGWHPSKDNIAHTLRVIEDLAMRCKDFDNLLGIELLNEPRQDVPLDIIKDYYRQGYERVRRHLGPERAAVVIHDAFRPFAWAGFMQEPEFKSVLLDAHLYQCFTDPDRRRDASGQIEMAAVERKQQLDRMQQALPCLVGEWSLGLPPQSMRGLDGLARDAAMRAFGGSQLLSYESTRGWVFWTYRTEEGDGWSFRDGVRRGWLPEKYDL